LWWAVLSLKILRDCRLKGDGVHHAMLKIPRLHDLALARHPDVLAAQRKERARIRSEKGIRWGGCPLAPAA
jgi:hypothetical protein